MEILKNPGTGNSVIIGVTYPEDKPKPTLNSSSAYQLGSIRTQVVLIQWYNDSSLDPVAEAFGSRLRDMLYASSGLPANTT